MAKTRTLCIVGALLVSASSARAGGESWVTFQDQTATRLVADPTVGLNNADEKEYAWGDVDNDGDVDLVAVYKQVGTTTGKRRNALFLNESGVLVDRTLEYGSASSVVLGDGNPSQGLLDLTNDRDVAVVDLTGDGWPEIVTSTTLSGNTDGTIGDKAVSHPRIYINLGDDPPGSGVWQGFIFDDVDRVPTMPAEPRFASAAAGDLDGDTDADLYFADYQQGPYTRPVDLNDRLWINNGVGYFSDDTEARTTATMVNSAFGTAVAIVDINGDGRMDVVKDTALTSPIHVAILYNNVDGGIGEDGFFDDFEPVFMMAPYHIAVGDLNNDLDPDIVISDETGDRYLLNIGNGADGLADFGPSRLFQGGPGFQFNGNDHVADLDRDGFNDVLIASVHVDLPSCGAVAMLYRNLGDVPDVTLTNQGPAGIAPAHLDGVHDFAVFDVNGDEWLDLVIGYCSGTRVYINQPPTGIAFAYPQGLPQIVPPSAPFDFTVDLSVQGPAELEPGSEMLHVSVNGGPFQASPMEALSETSYLASLPPGECFDSLSYYVSAGLVGGATHTDPADAPATTYEAVVATGTAVTFEDGIEGDVSDWTIASDASLTTGAWEPAVPIGTINAGFTAAPDEDAQPDPATRAFVTDNCPAAPCNAGDFDLDGGPTDLFSPLIHLEGADANISYQRWFYSSSTTGNDSLETAVTDNGADPSPTWVVVERVSSTFDGTDTAWQAASFRVGDFVTPTAEVRIRFRTNDVLPGSVVEAGIDLFSVETISCQCPCPADLSGDGLRDGGDIRGFVDCLLWAGTNCTCAEADGQAGLDSQDVAMFVQNLLAGTPCGG